MENHQYQEAEIFDTKPIISQIHTSHNSHPANKIINTYNLQKHSRSQYNQNSGLEHHHDQKPTKTISTDPHHKNIINNHQLQLNTISNCRSSSSGIKKLPCPNPESINITPPPLPRNINPNTPNNYSSFPAASHVAAKAMDYSSLTTPQIINFSSSQSDSAAAPVGNYSAQYSWNGGSTDVAVNAADGMMMMMISNNMTSKAFTATRTPAQAQDHVMAERKRREKLGQLFISLSKVVPGLKKLDKASLLEDAVNYLKGLKERVKVLEEEEMKSSSINSSNMDAISSKDRHSFFKDEMKSSSSDGGDEDDDGSTLINISESAAPEIKVRISNKDVLIKICCKKQKGLTSRIPYELEKMHLGVVDMRMMPFGDVALDITVLAQMHNEFQGTGKDIIEHLQQMVFFNPIIE